MCGNTVKQVLDLLVNEYGECEWRLRQGPIAVLVQTILSQNTSDRNSGRAFEQLLESFDGWGDIADAAVGEIAGCIRTGGLGAVKARYIKQVLTEIRRRLGGFDLSFLAEMPVDNARNWLKQLPGVGTKTASCVLLFALRMPALPVDTHIFRVANRTRIATGKTVLEVEKKLLKFIPDEFIDDAHHWLILHGRYTCTARTPKCSECIICDLCEYNKKTCT